jgi:CspA family cold shock protein
MESGKIKRLVADRGFGFITPDDGSQDVFFHHTALRGVKFAQLEVGDAVDYEAEEGEKGLRATTVSR